MYLSDRHQRLFQTSSSSSSSRSSAGEVPEIEPRRRLDDTYVGIIVGALAVFIVLIVAVSSVIAIRLRRKKYGGGSTGSPSKFIYSRGITGNGSSCRIVGPSAAEKSFMMTNGNAAYNTIVVDMNNQINKEVALIDGRLRQNGGGSNGAQVQHGLPSSAATILGRLLLLLIRESCRG